MTERIEHSSKSLASLVAGILFLALAVGACRDDEAEIHFQLASKVGSPPPVRVEFPGGFRKRVVDLTRSRNQAGPYTTRNSGTLGIRFWVVAENGELTSEGALELPLRNDWRWGVLFFIAPEDPISECFGCVGSERFDLDAALGYPDSVSLYLNWGGNSISDPVIY